MANVPINPKIYHITHYRNLAQVVQAGGIWSDAKCIQLRLDCEIVGMPKIKRRRLLECDVDCHPGTKVGQYVPFYFCPRSVMLYILHRGNHPEIDYDEGQDPIVHLEADMRAVVKWADQRGQFWAFTDCNASAGYVNFYADIGQLDNIDWEAVRATDWRQTTIQDHKQAEFLLYEFFPWHLVERIGVLNQAVAESVKDAIGEAADRPLVRVIPGWYY